MRSVRPALLGVLLGLGLAPRPARADDLPAVTLSGESRASAARLAEARKLIAARKWPEAITQLLAVIDSAGNDLVALEDGRCVQARRLCHLQVRKLPPRVLWRYRARVEPQARKWLERGLAERDPTWLTKVVDEAFCSLSAIKALDALGDLAFERGSFAEAESWWALLAPLVGLPRGEAEEAAALSYPRLPEEVVARARAKQLLARLFRSAPGWEADLKRFRAHHGKVAGKLAGRTGTYADILEAVARARKRRPPRVDSDWPTFGGDPGRGRVAAAPPNLLAALSQLCRRGPTWRFDLGRRERQEGELPQRGKTDEARTARSLAFYPVLTGHHLLVADARYVTAYDLRSGKAEEWYDAARVHGGIKPELSLPAPPDLRYTLTVAKDCVFARLGVQAIQDVRPAERKPGGVAAEVRDNSESILVCLSLKPNRKGERLRWTARAIDLGRKEYAVFEGAPVVADGRVFIAATRFEGDRVVTAVHCYPARPEDSDPPLLWKTDLCETRELIPAPRPRDRPGEGKVPPQGKRYRRHLLTLAGPRLVYCSHSGAIVSLDARTGRREWAVRYPRRDTREAEDDPDLRDLAPPLFADGRLYVAPADSDRLLCLDPTTGETIWERRRLDVVHLLGVGQGRLIFTTWRAPSTGRLYAGGLRAVGAGDGTDVKGWSLPDDGGGLAPLGRGLLVGDLVLWPTARKPYGVFAVNQKDGRQPDNPSLLHRLPAGNLLYANGYLAVASRRTLSVFVPPGLLLEEAEKAARAAPDSVKARLSLARAEAERGLPDRAVGDFALAERLAGSRRLAEVARRERREALLASAEQAGGARRWKEAHEVVRLAGAGAPAGERLHGLALAARLREGAGEPASAIEVWQSVLADEALRGLQVEDSAGLPVSASAWAAREIGRLRAAHGAGVYEAVEKQARALWSARAGEAADRLAREFPNAQVTRTALAELAAAHQRAGRSGAAGHAWRLLLAVGVQGPERDTALAGLRKVCAEVAGSPAEVALPLLRRWQADLEPGEALLSGEGPEGGRLYSARGEPSLLGPARRGELLCRSALTGKLLWRRALPFVPVWVGGHLGLVLAGGAWGVAGVRRDDGARAWLFPAPVEGRYPVGLPLAGEAPSGLRIVPDPLPPGPLAGFRLAEGRVFCLADRGRRLLSLDAVGGAALWQWRAPGAELQLPAPRGTISPDYYAGPRTLILWASARRWVLDSATGRVLLTNPPEREAWPRPPLDLGDGTVCLVPDAMRVQRLDAATGKVRWTYRLPGATTRSGEPPLVVAGPEALVVVIPENIGYRAQRLAKATGKPLWPRPRLLALERLDPGGWLVDQKAVYHADGRVACARSLADGAVLWEQRLAGGRLLRGHDTLLAWSAESASARFQFRWLGGSLQWQEGPLVGATVAVGCLDPNTGELVQSLNFEPGPARNARHLRLSREAGLMPWVALGREPDPWAQPTVWAAGPRLVVGVGGRAWGLRAEEGKKKSGASARE